MSNQMVKRYTWPTFVCSLQMYSVRRNTTVLTVHIFYLPLVINFIWCSFMKADDVPMYHKGLYSQIGMIQKHFMTRSMHLAVATYRDEFIDAWNN